MNWRQINRTISILLMGIIQVLFIWMIFEEHRSYNFITIAIIGILITLLISHARLPLHHDEHLYEHVFVAVWIPIAAVASYYLNNSVHLGPVMAAAVVGAIGSFFPQINKQSHYLKQLPAAIYCGAFIGMSSLKVANGIWFVLAASIFAGVGLVLSKNLFLGMGGKLGLIAFTGVVMASFIFFLVSKYAN